MNTIRMMAITLPMTLLLACGGGGTASVIPTTPPTGGEGGEPIELQALPTALITNAEAARNLITGSTSPTATATEAQQTFRSRIMDADVLFASDAYVVSPATPGGATVSTNGGVIINGNTHRVSLTDIQMGVADRFDLVRFNSAYAPVMVHREVTLAQYSAAGLDGSDVYEYLSYGGWLTNSAFSVDMLTINDGSDDESSLLVGVSYGDNLGSRPSIGGNNVSWIGSMVGVNRDTGDIIQGTANIQIFGDNTNIDLIEFNNISNLTNSSVSIGDMSWTNISLGTDGTFTSTTGGDIDGTFYGDGSEVGGTFNRNSIIGAFGADQL